ncbi:MAG: amino acid ABC transporter ATP-binding protein [Acidaminococcaceae bacterium]|nr:amino acid ABC transporter ATP-binding protein [Acidaminococcaceae bacterium]
MTEREILLHIEHLKKKYSGVTPLRDVNLDVRKGDVISVIGPSGTGKSTLLRMINRMEEATSGKIFYRNEEITSPHCEIHHLRQKIGMIFQSFNLFSHLTVVENIMAAPVDLLGMSKQAAYDRAKKLLARVSLESKAFSYPDELSGGQKQRIAIVRALAMEPEILLLDEPTSALDPTMVGEVEAVIRRVADAGVTMMLVTHDMNLARRVSNRVLYMDEGGVYEDAPPEVLFENPTREKTRRFVRQLKSLELYIGSRDFDFIGCNTSMEEFGMKNDIPKRIILSVMLVFEELCTQILLPRLSPPEIRWVVEYSKENETATVTADYNGEPFDITELGSEGKNVSGLTKEDALSLRLIRGRVRDMRWFFTDGKELGNRLCMTMDNCFVL